MKKRQGLGAAVRRASLPALLMVLAPAAWAQQAVSLLPSGRAKKAPPDEPKVVTLTVDPAAEPEPALKHRLLPELLDSKPGNAAPLYLMAGQFVPSGEAAEEDREKVRAWLKLPPKDLPRREAWGVVYGHTGAIHQVELAASREDCDWGLPIREEGLSLRLPPLSRQRELARVLALKARLQIAEGGYDEAIRTLETLFAMSRHLAEGPTLIEGLVGMAVAAMGMDQVEQLIQAPGSPNLYWALADLPRPLIDLRKSLEYERAWVFWQFPKARDLETADLSPAQWRAMNEEMERFLEFVYGRTPSRLYVTAYAIKAYPVAKRYLVAKGRAPAEVEAMPVQQALAIYFLREFKHWRDEMFKWHSLPYWQAREGTRQAVQSFQKWEQGEGKTNPLAQLLPALSRVRFLQARLDRQVAAAQCIEAVRMYAAGREGKLPATLDELTDAPALIDPVTGKAFVYTVDGGTFTLDAPAPPGQPRSEGRRYVVTVKARTSK